MPLSSKDPLVKIELENPDYVNHFSIKQNIFHNEDIEPNYNHIIEFDLGSVRSSLSGPKRPQDKMFLNDVKNVFNKEFESSDNNPDCLSDGSVVVAAITSCTNTSNPSVMIGAGLLAEKLNEKGLSPKSWVKTSMAPGSRVVTSYLEKSGLDKHLNNFRRDSSEIFSAPEIVNVSIFALMP